MGDGGVPSVPLTEDQLVEMVNRLERMPGPASLTNNTLLPPTDARLAPAQQFLRDYQTLGLEVPPPAEGQGLHDQQSMPVIRLSDEMLGGAQRSPRPNRPVLPDRSPAAQSGPLADTMDEAGGVSGESRKRLLSPMRVRDTERLANRILKSPPMGLPARGVVVHGRPAQHGEL